MTRLFSLSLVIALASSVHAQEKKDPPKDFTNSIGMKFVWIPPDSFMMGSPKEEKERFDHEGPQHKVTAMSLSGSMIGTETTRTRT
jgi:formylglycine-generating enzyme required for sulfatase activity